MMSEWIQCEGGDCPVKDKQEVFVRFRNLPDSEQDTAIGTELRWTHLWTDGDIVAYKIADATLANKGNKLDMVNSPSHYTAGKVECIDALEAATVNLSGIEAVCTANAIKYLWRWKQKNGVEDLRKARWYLDRMIEKMEIQNATDRR